MAGGEFSKNIFRYRKGCLRLIQSVITSYSIHYTKLYDYLGAAQISDTRGIQYGGAHVIEDLLRGKEIDVHATSYGTDCYPRKVLDTRITLEDLNEAVRLNPRNAYP